MFITFVGEGQKFQRQHHKTVKKISSIETAFERTFRYLELNITQKQNFSITFDQIQFIHETKSVEIPPERMKNKSDPLNENELKSY